MKITNNTIYISLENLSEEENNILNDLINSKELKEKFESVEWTTGSGGLIALTRKNPEFISVSELLKIANDNELHT